MSPHAKELYADFSAGQPSSKPEDMLYSGNFEALDDWDIPAKIIDDLLSRNPKKEEREIPTPAVEDVQPCAPTASDVPLSQSQSVDADARQGEEDDAANPTDAAPASPADAGAATQSLSAADPASLAAESAQPAFDYSGLDDQTVADLHLAEREYSSGKKMAEMGLRRMADAVAIAHDALCGGCDNLSQAHNNQYSKDTFGAWCESIGIHRKAAERLLQVSKLMDNSSPREQKVLEELTPSVLYEASRPSAEPEAVEALKQQQVKTLKEYRELEARLKAEAVTRVRLTGRISFCCKGHSPLCCRSVGRFAPVSLYAPAVGEVPVRAVPSFPPKIQPGLFGETALCPAPCRKNGKIGRRAGRSFSVRCYASEMARQQAERAASSTPRSSIRYPAKCRQSS